MTDIAVCSLADHAEAIPRIAGWFHDEWRDIYGTATQASVRSRIETWLSPDKIPTALVAVAGDQVIGTVALKESELQFPYSPWLAGLYVVREFRGAGIGRLLVGAAEQKALSLGVPDLYLYTPASRAFYEDLGWSLLRSVRLPSGPVAVMSKRLQPHLPVERTLRLPARRR